MKRNSFGTLSLAVLSLMLVTGARAQSIEEANVPFAFQAGVTLLPAGRYIIKEDHVRETIRVRNVDNGLVAVVPVQQSALGAVKAALVFRNVGDQHFLAEVCGGEDHLDLTIPPSNKEKHARASAAPSAQTTLVAFK
jgi:hypothetical protein